MDVVPEFSRPVLASVIPTGGTEVEFAAETKECAALAERFGIISIENLIISAKLKSISKGALIRLDGRVRARVVQSCVVTLEPVVQDVDEKFTMVYGECREDEGGDMDFSVDDEDPPEMLVNGAVDVGEAAAEHLALSLDPFPRKPGAELPQAEESTATIEVKKNPFAILSDFRQKKR